MSRWAGMLLLVPLVAPAQGAAAGAEATTPAAPATAAPAQPAAKATDGEGSAPAAQGRAGGAEPAQDSASGKSQWRLTGSTTTRYDRYRVSGEEGGSPYVQNSEQSYQDLELTLDGTTAEGKHWQFQFAGVLSDAEYRSPERGFVPERLYMLHEDPNAAVPYRVELGDQYLDLTPLTLRKTLKAARVELQPSSRVAGRSYSVVFASGAAQDSWRQLDLGEDYYHAASFLMDDASFGKLSLNLAYNGRSADAETGAPAMGQWVGSVGYAKDFTLGSQQLAFQGEWAQFRGDVAEYAYEDDPSRSGTGLFAQLDGQDQDRPLDYQLRYQRYGEDFQPNGAVVPSGVQAVDGRAGWNFDNGWRLEGDLGWEQSDFQSDNPTTTKRVGVAASGPVHTGRERPLQLRAEVNQESRTDQAGHTDTTDRRARVDVAIPVGKEAETTVGVGVSQHRDQLDPQADSSGYQLDLAHRQPLKLGDMDLTVKPGVGYARENGPRPTETVSTGLEVDASKGRHNLSAQLSAQFQNDLAGNDDVDTYRAGVGYSYRKDQHSVGVELTHERRDAVGGSTDSSQIGVFYRYDFDKNLGED